MQSVRLGMTGQLLHLAAAESADPALALSVLQPFQSLTHVQLGGREGGQGRGTSITGAHWVSLLRSLAGGGLPQLTSFDLTFDDVGDAMENLNDFLARRTSLQSLRLRFCHLLSEKDLRDKWRAVHASLEALDFSRLSRLKHLTLDYRRMYDPVINDHDIRGSSPYDAIRGSRVPVSSFILSLRQAQGQAQGQEQGQEQGQGQRQGQGQAQEQALNSVLRTFELQVSSEALMQGLPGWLGELQPLFSLSIICTDNSWWKLQFILGSLRTLQELLLEIHPQALSRSPDWLSSLQGLSRLKRLRLHVHGSPLPKVPRVLPGLEGLELRLERGPFGAPLGQIPSTYFAFAPNLRSLSLWSCDALTWPLLVGLTRLTSLSLGCQMAGQVLPTCCNVGGLPALRQLELQTCRLLPMVEGLFGLGRATAGVLHCQCKDEVDPVKVGSYAEVVQAGCQQALSPGRATAGSSSKIPGSRWHQELQSDVRNSKGKLSSC
eukprot:jgi/Mesen1/2238/ME000152S01324